MWLVLASRSPRRREILSWLRPDFEALDPRVDELTEGLSPDDLVLENARRKARAGLALASLPDSGDLLVLGVDTEVFLDGRALGQPEDRAQAEERLRALSGREHTVLSGVCLLRPHDDSERVAVARSAVTFNELGEGQLTAYLDSEEWRGRAGGYAIQGLGSILIRRVEGDFSNVVGLPIATLLELAPEIAEGRFPHRQ